MALHLGYTGAQMIDLLTRRAAALNLPIANPASLKTKLSRWENGKEQPSEIYRRLFREIYGRTNAELGFPDEPEEDPEATELRSRLAVDRTVDRDTVEVFRHQVDHARHVDRRFGALTPLRTQLDQVQQLLTYRAGPQLPALAGVLVEAATLAGWQALDRAAPGQAWTHDERARAAAHEADSPALLAHATAGHAHDARRAFDTAKALRPADPIDPTLPFLFLGDSHLDRWRGNALARVGAPEAIDQLTTALARLPADFVRARIGLLVDLAYAHAAAGDRDAALAHARQARRLAGQIKSDRHQRRLNRLVLPGSGSATT
ncbi:MAG: tetratricopeptide repeat protein [Pseudonocardiaceae bacterium]